MTCSPELVRVREAAERLHQLAAAATPAPWWVHDHSDGCDLWAGDQDAIRSIDADGCCASPAAENCDGTCDRLSALADPLAHGEWKRAADAALSATQDPAYAVLVADLMGLVADRYQSLSSVAVVAGRPYLELTVRAHTPGWATVVALADLILAQAPAETVVV